MYIFWLSVYILRMYYNINAFQLKKWWTGYWHSGVYTYLNIPVAINMSSPDIFAGWCCEIQNVCRRNSFDWNNELPEAASLSIEFHNHYTNMSKAGQKEVKCKFFLQAIIMYMETSQISFWQGSQNSRHLYQKLCICAAFIDIYHWKVIVGGLSMRRDVLPQF